MNSQSLLVFIQRRFVRTNRSQLVARFEQQFYLLVLQFLHLLRNTQEVFAFRKTFLRFGIFRT